MKLHPQVTLPGQRHAVVIGEVGHIDGDVACTAIGQGHGHESRRFERGKVEGHQADSIGFTAIVMPEWVIVTAASGWQGAATSSAIIAARATHQR
jgi:hypothetical protein